MGVFTMPSLGADMEAGTLVEWLKQPGERVDHGDIIAVVETDKGAIEVEVFEAGEIEALLVDPGQSVPVGTALARIAGDGHAEGHVSDDAGIDTDKPPAAAAAAVSPPEQKRPPRIAAELRASPAARTLAADRGIDLAAITGTGPDGAIQLSDVESAGVQPATAHSNGVDPSAMRRAIAAAMGRSKRDIPHYYLMHRIDMAPTLSWLSKYNEARAPAERLLLGVVLLKAAAVAVGDFPDFNGFYKADGYQPSEAVHVGSAISIRGGGLAAPAIRNTAEHSLPDLMKKLRDLVARTRRGELRSSEIGDPTVTISSLGERGVDSLWPIIYPPQVAIIGFGSPRTHPWASDDALAIRPVMNVSLAGDHRANDGHRGALLLRHIEELLAHPEDL